LHGDARGIRPPKRFDIGAEASEKSARSDFETEVSTGAIVARSCCVRVSPGSRFRVGSKLLAGEPFG